MARKAWGLYRAEHMFMGNGRLEVMHDMILSEGEGASEEALAELETLQKGESEDICKAMEGLPVTVRLLAPPVRDFLPDSRELVERLVAPENENGYSGKIGELRRQLRVIKGLEEANRMLGLRACCSGIPRRGSRWSAA